LQTSSVNDGKQDIFAIASHVLDIFLRCGTHFRAQRKDLFSMTSAFGPLMALFALLILLGPSNSVAAEKTSSDDSVCLGSQRPCQELACTRALWPAIASLEPRPASWSLGLPLQNFSDGVSCDSGQLSLSLTTRFGAGALQLQLLPPLFPLRIVTVSDRNAAEINFATLRVSQALNLLGARLFVVQTNSGDIDSLVPADGNGNVAIDLTSSVAIAATARLRLLRDESECGCHRRAAGRLDRARMLTNTRARLHAVHLRGREGQRAPRLHRRRR
jgi:hypothetical protein